MAKDRETANATPHQLSWDAFRGQGASALCGVSSDADERRAAAGRPARSPRHHWARARGRRARSASQSVCGRRWSGKPQGLAADQMTFEDRPMASTCGNETSTAASL